MRAGTREQPLMLHENWWEVPTQAPREFRLDLRIRMVGELSQLLDAQYLARCKLCSAQVWAEHYRGVDNPDSAEIEKRLLERWNDVDTDANAVWVRWLIHVDDAHPDHVFFPAGTPMEDRHRMVARLPIVQPLIYDELTR